MAYDSTSNAAIRSCLLNRLRLPRPINMRYVLTMFRFLVGFAALEKAPANLTS